MIYLLEDDESIRKFVIYALKQTGLEACGFPLPSLFKQAVEEKKPELALLDIMLPEEDGLSILKRLRTAAKTQDLPVIMLTAKDSEYDKVTGLDMGADDYISKPFGMTELIARVKALLRRSNRSVKETSAYTLGSLYVDPKKHIIRVGGADVQLSYKEYSLLMALLEACGNVVTRDALLTKVWGECYDESRTLDVHIRKLRVKLGEAGELIKTVKSIGYKIGGAE